MQTHPCVKRAPEYANIAQTQSCASGGSGLHVHCRHKEKAGKRQRSQPSPSLVPGERLIPRINIRASSTPAALHVLD